jgi:hypothetical protein
MKSLAILFSVLCTFSTVAHAGRTNAVLPAVHYDLAEFVFRQYMLGDSKVVFHLAYGTNSASLPAKFVARFKGQTPLVRGTPDGITVVSNKIVLDKITRKEAVGLCIREIRVTGDTAEIQVLYFASYTSNLTRFYLVREKGKWRVKERKVESISCG